MAHQGPGYYFWSPDPQDPPRFPLLHNFIHGRLPFLSAQSPPTPDAIPSHALEGDVRISVDRPNSLFSRRNSHPSTVPSNSSADWPSHSPSNPRRNPIQDVPATVTYYSARPSESFSSSSMYDRERTSWHLPPPVYTTDPEPDSDPDDESGYASDYTRPESLARSDRGVYSREDGGHPPWSAFGFDSQVFQRERGHEGEYTYAHGPPQDHCGGYGNQGQHPAQPHLHYASPHTRNIQPTLSAIYYDPYIPAPTHEQDQANVYTPRRQPQEAARDPGMNRGPMPPNVRRQAMYETRRERGPGVSSGPGQEAGDGQAGGEGEGAGGRADELARGGASAIALQVWSRTDCATHGNPPINPVTAPSAGLPGPLPVQPQPRLQSQPQPQFQTQLLSQTLRITLPALSQNRMRDYLTQLSIPYYHRNIHGIPTYSVRIYCDNLVPFGTASITFAPLMPGAPPQPEEWPSSFFTQSHVSAYPEHFAAPWQREGEDWDEWKEGIRRSFAETGLCGREGAWVRMLEKTGGLEIRCLVKPVRSEGAAGGAVTSAPAMAPHPMDVNMVNRSGRGAGGIQMM